MCGEWCELSPGLLAWFQPQWVTEFCLHDKHREAPVHRRLKNESDVCHGLLIVGQLSSGKHQRYAINSNNHPHLELLHLLWTDKLSFDRTYTRDVSSKGGCEHATLTLHQLRWSSTLSIDKAIIFTSRFLNSPLSLAARASSVVHTGVKSLGWENRIPHLQKKYTHTQRAMRNLFHPSPSNSAAHTH